MSKFNLAKFVQILDTLCMMRDLLLKQDSNPVIFVSQYNAENAYVNSKCKRTFGCDLDADLTEAEKNKVGLM